MQQKTQLQYQVTSLSADIINKKCTYAGKNTLIRNTIELHQDEYVPLGCALKKCEKTNYLAGMRTTHVYAAACRMTIGRKM